ncbi:glycolipid transfer protein 3-like [Humulus lupulus]|uniref:glycolipid transfer protein 3-like n=1 Tax=Humulus lupulus TaxID=3486 RepID=UPI002B405A8D|nr:glycolipid transfer protein 3-like [Humulus lupulus]
MKRKREMEAMSSEKKSEIRSAIEELSMLANLRASHDDHNHDNIEPKIPFQPFVSVCNLLLLVLDKIGPTMAVLRQDIHQNIQRLEVAHEADSSTYSNLVEILKKEAAQGNAKKVNSCSRALLWLTRSLDFTVELLQNYSASGSDDENMNQIVEDAYNITLKPWHGWISSTAVKVALKLVPGHKTFLNALMEKDDENPDSLREELQTFVSLLKPLLEDIHSSLRAHGVDRLKST